MGLGPGVSFLTALPGGHRPLELDFRAKTLEIPAHDRLRQRPTAEPVPNRAISCFERAVGLDLVPTLGMADIA